MNKLYGDSFNLDDLYGQLGKKCFKKTYSGKPTKRYLTLITRIDDAESIPIDSIERMMAI
mgnify:CR=1 FL=1